MARVHSRSLPREDAPIAASGVVTGVRHTHRAEKPLAVVDEVEWLMSTTSQTGGGSPMTFLPFITGASRLRRRNASSPLHIPFECISRADRLNTESEISSLSWMLPRWGRFGEWFAENSGCDAAGVTGAVQSAIAMCKARGIQTGMFLMWGYEGKSLPTSKPPRALKRSDPDIFSQPSPTRSKDAIPQPRFEFPG